MLSTVRAGSWKALVQSCVVGGGMLGDPVIRPPWHCAMGSQDDTNEISFTDTATSRPP